MMRSLVGNVVRSVNAGARCSSLRSPLVLANCVRLLSDSGKYPKHQILNLPALSPTMETGNLISWSVKEGDKVSEGDVLAEIETDKASIGFEVVDGGYVAKRLVEAGTKGIPLGTPICVLVDTADDVAAFKDYVPETEPGKQEKKTQEVSPPAPSPAPPTPEAVKPVEKSSTADPTVIAKALIPHYYLTSMINVEQLDSLVRSDPSISKLALIVKAASIALKKVPDVNSCWTDACIRRYNHVNIKVMDYDKPAAHVINAQDKSLKGIQEELNSPTKAKANATFTIRNCPETSACAAIIDPTQAAVLCIGQSHSIAVPLAPNSAKMTSAVCATLSCDHRVVDGAVGAGWLKEFKKILECPALISL